MPYVALTADQANYDVQKLLTAANSGNWLEDHYEVKAGDSAQTIQDKNFAKQEYWATLADYYTGNTANLARDMDALLGANNQLAIDASPRTYDTNADINNYFGLTGGEADDYRQFEATPGQADSWASVNGENYNRAFEEWDITEGHG